MITIKKKKFRAALGCRDKEAERERERERETEREREEEERERQEKERERETSARTWHNIGAKQMRTEVVKKRCNFYNFFCINYM